MQLVPLALSLMFATAGLAQTPGAPLRFDTASVKPSTAIEDGKDADSHTGSLTMRNYTLRALISFAYGVQETQISGGPKWMDSDCYDITAKAAGPALRPERLLMLQSLLADRFHLAIHRESKPSPGYALLAAKGGLKIQPVENTGDHSTGARGGVLTFTGTSMARLADWLSQRLNAPVVDATEVTGVFDFTLKVGAGDRPSAGAAAVVPVASDPTSSVFDAFRNNWASASKRGKYQSTGS
jgi:uncharacterized protein (TIGR03435 family)